jgi:hypothetical protein
LVLRCIHSFFRIFRGEGSQVNWFQELCSTVNKTWLHQVSRTVNHVWEIVHYFFNKKVLFRKRNPVDTFVIERVKELPFTLGLGKRIWKKIQSIKQFKWIWKILLNSKRQKR